MADDGGGQSVSCPGAASRTGYLTLHWQEGMFGGGWQ
eukprot:CAMPEP_0197882546 /NCGR_PEP_ID=MMETSP1439-20131203/9660_1 /TAXON_ID=66791 /ORGANISM="Gonyaulax spinifera, Strain CCMP409" /LENGTH=36 /DNA_ID= /DNA_START= /DNA_END= /DNA_ORIENTATION=